ncbi:MAG: hypothetical protein BWY02_02032 [bacterium ADurb.Bin157]|nr:MAG: hypothetical protein BWY02_02032 [bacterium ADurb.Bin157]
MIVKPNNILMAVFDEFKKPGGKKKFITRRLITRASKPLLSEKHLPTLVPGRGKKCFSTNYSTIYKSDYAKETTIDFTPLIENVFLTTEKINELKNFTVSEIINHNRKFIPFINPVNIVNEYCINGSNFTICSENAVFISKAPDLRTKSKLSSVKSNKENDFKVLLYDSSHIKEVYNNAQNIIIMKGISSAPRHSAKKHDKQFDYGLPTKSGAFFRDSAKRTGLLKFSNFKFNILDFVYISETEDYFACDSKVTEADVRLIEANVGSDSLLFIVKAYKEVFFEHFYDTLPLYTRNSIHCLSSSSELIEHNFTQKHFIFLEHFSKTRATQIRNRKSPQSAISKSKIKENFAILENSQGIKSEKKDSLFKFQNLSNYKISHLSHSYKNSLKAEYSSPNISGKLINSTVRFITSIIRPRKIENVSYKHLKASAIPSLKSTVNYFKKDIVTIAGFKTKKHKMFFKGALHAKYTLRTTKNIAKGKDFRIKNLNKKNNIYIFIEKNKLLRLKSKYDFCFSLPHKRKYLLPAPALKMALLYSAQSFSKVCFGKSVKKVKQPCPAQYIYYHPKCQIKRHFTCLYKTSETENFGAANFILNKRIFLFRKQISDITNSVDKNIRVQSSYFSNFRDSLYEVGFKFVFCNLIKPIQHVFFEQAMLLIGLRKPMTVHHTCLSTYSESAKNYIIPQKFNAVIKSYKCKTHLNPYPFGFPSFLVLPDNYKCILKKTLMGLKIFIACKKVYSDNYILKNERIYRHPLSLKAPQKFIFSGHKKLISEPDYYYNRNQMPTSRLSIIKLSAIKQSWEIRQISSKLKIRKLFKMQKGKFSENLLFANRFTFSREAIYSDVIKSDLTLKRTQINYFLLRTNNELLVFSKNDKFAINNKSKSKFSIFTETILSIPKELNILSQYLDFNLKSNNNFYFSLPRNNRLTQYNSHTYKTTFRSFRFPYKPELHSTILKPDYTRVDFKTDQFLSNETDIINGQRINKFYFKRINLVKFITDGYRGLDTKLEYLCPSNYSFAYVISNWLGYIGKIESLSIIEPNFIKVFSLFDSDNLARKILLFSKMRYLKPNSEYIFAYYPNYPELTEKGIKLNVCLNKNLNITDAENANFLLNKINNAAKLSFSHKYLINESKKHSLAAYFKGTAVITEKTNFYESEMSFLNLIQKRKKLTEGIIEKNENIMLSDIQIKDKSPNLYNQDKLFNYLTFNSSDAQAQYSQIKEEKAVKLSEPKTQITGCFRKLMSNDFTESFYYKTGYKSIIKDELNNETAISSAFEKKELRCPGIPDWIDMEPIYRLKEMALLA